MRPWKALLIAVALLFVSTAAIASQTIPPVTVTTQPQNITVYAGQSATFTAEASDTCRTLYATSWGNAYGPVTQKVTYTTPALTTAASGHTFKVDFYSCKNSSGEVWSQVATVTVIPPPACCTVNLTSNAATLFSLATVTSTTPSTSTAVCQISGSGNCTFTFDPTQNYQVTLLLAGVPIYTSQVLSGSLLRGLFALSVTTITTAVNINGSGQIVTWSDQVQ